MLHLIPLKPENVPRVTNHFLHNLDATVNPECTATFNELKLGKSLKYIIYKLSDDYKEIVVEESGTDPDWENFQKKIIDAKTTHRGKEGRGPRYAVYDFQYELEAGEGTRWVVFFLFSSVWRGKGKSGEVGEQG
ncbi:MAG: hypothetical protein LQ346_007759 [Caloplaca aetnensis]|nr:MAG: hypothetical protein LQ346_007759 [Caloplaca aetnensis]